MKRSEAVAKLKTTVASLNEVYSIFPRQEESGEETISWQAFVDEKAGTIGAHISVGKDGERKLLVSASPALLRRVAEVKEALARWERDEGPWPLARKAGC